MHEFDRRAFSRASNAERAVLQARLAELLGARVRAAVAACPEDAEEERERAFHLAVGACIEDLRAVGYELFSFDESHDFEIWMRREGAGLALAFRIDGGVTVEWADAR
ncbi:MAG TPA: hypothetical protein VGI39_20155 [Polyangiaceae bacterium]